MASELTDDEVISRFHTLGVESLPAGFYLVRPDGRFLLASMPVRQMLGLGEGKLNASIADLYVQERQRDKLLRRADEATQQGGQLEEPSVHFRVQGENGKPRDVWVQMFCKRLVDEQSGETIGYYGCLVDRTEEHDLQRRLEELTLDIGRVLHANSTTLQMVDKALRPVLEFIARQVNLSFQAAVTIDPDHLLDRSVQRVSDYLEALIESAQGDEWRWGALLRPQWEFLQQAVRRLRGYAEEVEVKEAQPGFLRRLVADIRDTLEKAHPRRLPKEQVKKVKGALEALERATLLAPLVNAYIGVKQMDTTLMALRDFVTTGVRPEEPKKVLLFNDVIRQAIENLREFANNRGIEVRVEEECPETYVKGVWRDLLRAFANLIHNAIKYTWHRSAGRPPWISVRVTCEDKWVRVTVENWGVPISRDEIESRSIFEIGYRGRRAHDRYRLGTGIGLADAQRVFERQHGGVIEVESRPARKGGAEDENDPAYFNQPFLTRFTVSLPTTLESFSSTGKREKARPS